MIYVVDTSVVLSDPKALERMGDKHVVLPLAVLQELESKRTHPELGYPARNALKYLESFRKVGSITEPSPTGDGGSIRVEVNHVDDSALPPSFRSEKNDHRILAVAYNLMTDGEEVTLLTNDLPLRLSADIVGLRAEEFDGSVRPYVETVQEIEVHPDVIEAIYHDGYIDAGDMIPYPVNTMFIMKSGKQSVLCRLTQEMELQLVTKHTGRLETKSARQHFAMDLLTDPEVGIVSLGGQAGSGKTVMALAAAWEAYKRREVSKIIVFRPVQAVGEQDLGYLPGTQEEKMEPWARAIYDAIEAFLPPSERNEAKQRIEVLPLSHIRGRTLKESFVIVDEAQNLDLMTLVTTMTRIGEGSKIVLTHDVSQRDNLKVGKHDGIAKVVANLSGSPLFGHVTLNKSERSKIAQMVADAFDI